MAIVMFRRSMSQWNFAILSHSPSTDRAELLSLCSLSTWTALVPQNSAPFESDSHPWTLGAVLVWGTVLWS